MYTGTSNIAYPTMGGMAAALLARSVRRCSSRRRPSTSRGHVADAVHGLWLGGRNRLEDADAWLFVGTNPVISKQFIGENPAQQFHRAVDRGMQLVVIDPVAPRPRASRTSTCSRARTKTPRWSPPSCTSCSATGSSTTPSCATKSTASRTPRRGRAVHPRVRGAAGRRPVDDLLDAARVLGTARRGGTGGGTGVSMSGGGSLVSYLLLCINSVRGFWARAATGSSGRTCSSRRTAPRRRSRPFRPGDSASSSGCAGWDRPSPGSRPARWRRRS